MIDLSDFVGRLGGKPVAVFGLGLSGVSTVKALLAAGGQVIAWDDCGAARERLFGMDVQLEELNAKNLKKCACLVLTPGVPLFYPKPHPVVKAAQKAGCEIIGDIELLYRSGHKRKTIGLTGTNGKSTTTALISHVLNHVGYEAVLGGNIGTPVLALKLPNPMGCFVLEVSSFQIDLCPSFRPDISVILNITPDHLDRYGSMERYAASKASLAEGKGTLIIGIDDHPSMKICAQAQTEGTRRVIPISAEKKAPGGVYVLDGILFDDMEGKNEKIGSLNNIVKLHGQHNKQNAAAAYAMARLHDVPVERILRCLKSYPGLPHRQFPVRMLGGVAYINDSKATNPTAVGKAFACNKNIYWIAGGKMKDGNLDELEPYIDRLRHAFLIGEAMKDFAKWLDRYGVPYNFSHTLGEAVQEAHDMAQDDRGQPGGTGTVLLSPACSSFDQFENFEERGWYFTSLVNALDGDWVI